jgi:hypothetical protein
MVTLTQDQIDAVVAAEQLRLGRGLTDAEEAAAIAAATEQATLTDNLANLYALRDTGLARKLQKIGPIETETWTRSDSDLLAAIASLERRLGRQPLTKMVVRSSKGW